MQFTHKPRRPDTLAPKMIPKLVKIPKPTDHKDPPKPKYLKNLIMQRLVNVFSPQTANKCAYLSLLLNGVRLTLFKGSVSMKRQIWG